MLDHHLQRAIVYNLALAHSLRFSELKPDTVDSKLFTYHLKKVVAAGYVAKDADGQYTLTPEGRRLGIRVLYNQGVFEDQADSVLFLVIRRKSDGAWLLYKRSTHPLIDRIGFMHAPPSSAVTVAQAAQSFCLKTTGLDCDFRTLGGGYFRVYDGDNLESFTHFTLLVCDDAQGELSQDDKHADYFWSLSPDFTEAQMLPNTPMLVELYQIGKPFFIEKTFQL